MKTFIYTAGVSLALVACQPKSDAPVQNDSLVPLHLLQPDYSIPYGEVSPESIKETADRVLLYLQEHTHASLETADDGHPVSADGELPTNTQLKRGDFRIASYEWGVVHSGMLHMHTITKDGKYADYVKERLQILADAAPGFEALLAKNVQIDAQMRQVLRPKALDDAGSMAAAMIRAHRFGVDLNQCEPLIENYIDFVANKEIRLEDGMFGRNRPYKNSVWLDDMYMSLPALAEYAKHFNKPEYMDEVAKQIRLFRDKMFVPETQLFRHGWVQEMNPHPAFYWGRANGWAILTLCDVLDVIPQNHEAYNEILSLMQAHLAGLARLQSGSGFWHQLLDRNDTYLETSATAIYTYAFAHAINQGWVDAKAYGPVAQLGWSAVSTAVNAQGQVEGTCVGTGMGFDPAFYAHRPISPFAAHGYGPVLLAAAETFELMQKGNPKSNDRAMLYYDTAQNTKAPIFEEMP